MSKFGELLDEKKPLLLVFFSEYDELSSSLHPTSAAAEKSGCKEVGCDPTDKGHTNVWV